MSELLAALINGGIAGTVVTMAIWAALAMAPRSLLNAATRYAIWWTTLLAVVTLPVFYLPHHAESAAIPAVTYQALQNIAVSENVSTPVFAPVANELNQASRWPQFPLEFNAGVWPGRIFTAWGIIAALMFGRLLASYVVLERRKNRARVAEELKDWPVRALISPDIASPMAAGLFRPAILLPERLLLELDAEELDQIRVHETAHLLRRDDVALLLQRSLEALFVIHPAVRWITRRIDLEREIACDDFVIQQTGKARPYASCLTRVVEIAGGVRSSLVAAAATEERSHLAQRIEMLLDKTRHKGTRLLKIRLLCFFAALLALACVVVRNPGIIAFAAESLSEQTPAAPEPPAAIPEVAAPAPPATPAVLAPPPAPAPPAPSQSTWSEHGNHTSTWRTSDGMHSREMRMRGDVHFNDDETDVISMSADGFFGYEESFGFSSRRYQATSDSSGKIVRIYLVDGREKPLDADAQAWLRAALPDLLRESGIDAADRVRRIFKQGGAPAVLAEVNKIHSDGTKRVYIRELVSVGNLNTDQYQSLMRIVRGMNSDGEKAALLVSLAPNVLKDNLRDYAFEAVKTIHSDGEKHRVLTQFILQDSSRSTMTMAARAVQDINSDGEKAAVLVDLAPHLRGNADLPRPFFHATESIHSDGERTRVLMTVIASAGEQRDTLSDALHAAESMGSDGEKARILVHADAYWKEDDMVRRAYFETAKSIHSDGEKAHVLTSLIGRGNLSDRTLIETIHCATHINSDGEKARVLVAVASRSTGKTDVRDEIKTAAGSIHSDGEYRRVMASIDLRASNVPNRP